MSNHLSIVSILLGKKPEDFFVGVQAYNDFIYMYILHTLMHKGSVIYNSLFYSAVAIT